MSSSPHDLPAETTSFVGRAAELARLSELFDGGARLVTITGAGGMGKSRLAARHASAAAETGRWPGGILRCDLAAADDYAASLLALEHAVKSDREDRAAAADGRAPVITGRGERLVILEHVEHALAEVRRLVAALEPRARVLVTTRERLGLTHEWCLVLGPLALEPTEGAESEAVRLLLDRGRTLGFDPSRTCSRACRSCERLPGLMRALDGNPLAIELAANRLGLMTPCQILDRIGRRFELLGSPSVALRDAIARSWETLSPAERAVMCQLAIFGGAFDLEAVEHVVNHLEPHALLDVLDALVRKSLVQVMPTPGAKGNPLRLYENDRAFARARLEGDRELLAASVGRHAAWVVGRLARPPNAQEGPEAQPIDARAELLTAIEWALHPEVLTDDSVIRAFEMLIRLQPTLGSRATLERAVPLFQVARAHAHRVPTALSTRAHTTMSEALYLHGRGGEALAVLERARADFADTEDPVLEALLVRSLGASHFYGRADVSIAELERAQRALEASGHTVEALDTTMRLARAHENEGEVEDAIALYQVALERARAAGEKRRIALALLNLGALQAHLGFDAGPNYRAALAWGRELDDHLLEAVALTNLGIAAFERRDDEAARAFFDEATRVEARLGVGRLSAITRGHQAMLCHLRGEFDEARRLYREALSMWKHVWPDPLTWSLLTMGLAVLSAKTGDVVEAQRQLGRLALVNERSPGPEPATSTLIRLAELGVGAAHMNADGATMESARELARPALAALARRPRGGVVALRVALRLLGLEPTAQPTAVLAIARGGHRFVTPEGKSVELGRRGPARRVLAELAARRVSGEGQSLGVEDLFEAAWPGEKIQPPYRANRVYVVIADLRKIGLEGLLLNDGDGYLLDPATPVVVIDA